MLGRIRKVTMKRMMRKKTKNMIVKKMSPNQVTMRTMGMKAKTKRKNCNLRMKTNWM